MINKKLDIFSIKVENESELINVQDFLFSKGYKWYFSGLKHVKPVSPFPFYLNIDNKDMDISWSVKEDKCPIFTLHEIGCGQPVELFKGETWSVWRVNGEEQVIQTNDVSRFKKKWELEDAFKKDLLDSVNSNGEDFVHKEWEIAKEMINKGWTKVC